MLNKAVRRLSVALAIMLLVGGCRRSSGGDAVERARENEARRFNEDAPFIFTATMTGDADATLTGEVLTRFARHTPIAPTPATPRFLAMEQFQPITTDGKAARFSITLVGYRGNGKLEIEPGSRSDPNPTASGGSGGNIRSQIQVMWAPSGDVNATPVVYDRRMKRCTAEFFDDGFRGTIRCPELATAEGKHINLVLDWHKK